MAEPESFAPLAAMSGPRKLSYVLLAALLVLAVALKLAPMLLAGLFAYLLLDLSHRRLSQVLPPLYARLATFAFFIVACAALGWIFWEFLRQAMAAMPRLLARALPALAEELGAYGIILPFETLEDFREAFMDSMRENAVVVTKMTGLLTKRFFHILAGIFVAILCFFSPGEPALGPNFYDNLRREMHDRVLTFMRSFELVFGAQLVTSGINTAVTAAYLLATGIPFMAFLVPATFVLGLLPVVGNVVSNTLIFSAAFTVSPRLAFVSLAVLVLMHKAEYFLNIKVLGNSLRSPMWLILVGIIVGELVMGVPGIVLAPALLHYLRAELKSLDR